MKNLVIPTLFCLLSAAPNSARASDNVLVRCRFARSQSVSFGYSDVYTITGDLKESKLGPFYEPSGEINASVDQTASTNFPGKHLGETPITLVSGKGRDGVLLAIAAQTPVNGETFQILVFREPESAQGWSAYEILWPTGAAITGFCSDLDSRFS